MKKIIISLVALAAIAGAASAAQNRSYDLRDLETLNGYTSDGAFLPTFKHGMVKSNQSVKPMLPVIDHTGEHQNSTI
jgi:hypothetical protein